MANKKNKKVYKKKPEHNDYAQSDPDAGYDDNKIDEGRGDWDTNSSEWQRKEQGHMDNEKRDFKRGEHEAEYSREQEIDNQRQKQDEGIWYVRADGKVLRTDDGQPKEFYGKKNANTAGVAHKRENPDADVMLSTSPQDKGGGITEGALTTMQPRGEKPFRPSMDAPKKKYPAIGTVAWEQLPDWKRQELLKKRGHIKEQCLDEAQSFGGALNNALSKVEPGSKLDQKIKNHNRAVKSGSKDNLMTSTPDGYHFKKDGSISLGDKPQIKEDDVVLAPGKGRQFKPGLLNKPEVSINPTDVVKVDVPLLIRLMEYAKEDAPDDMALHDLAEKLVAGCQRGRTLSMKDYDSLVPDLSGPFGHPEIETGPDQQEPEVDEGRFTHGPGGVPLDRQGNAIPPKPPVAPKAPAVRRDANGLTRADYNTVWRKIEDVVGQIFPDGDPIDWLIPWFKQKRLYNLDMGAILDKACRLNGYKDIYAYYDHFKTGDYGYEAPVAEEVEPKLVSGPGERA